MNWTEHKVSCHDTPITSILTYGFVIDGNLDPQILKNSFERVVERWPILGSRAGRDHNGELIWRAPTKFSSAIPHFTSSHHRTPSVPLDLPKPSTRTPSIHLGPSKALFAPPAHLHHSSIEGYITASQPIFHVQITALENDVTAVGITVPHAFCDAGGMKEILKEWNVTMHRRLSESNQGEGEGRRDIVDATLFLEKIGMSTSRKEELPKGLWIHDISNGPTPNSTSKTPTQPTQKGEGKWVFVRNDWLADLKRRCVDEIEGGSWVSEGDVLYAWWAKTVYSPSITESAPTAGASNGAYQPAPRPLVITIPMDLRTRLNELSSSSKKYLHNAVGATVLTYPSVEAFHSLSIAHVALQIRQAITSHTEDEIRQTLRIKTDLAHGQNKRRSVATHFPPGGVERITLSNWLKMSWPSRDQLSPWLDFSPAIVAKRPSTSSYEDGASGSGSVIWSDIGFLPGVGARPAGMAVSRDQRGVWMWFSMADWRWDAVDKVLKAGV
ncbi:hypothetical protein CI109_100015 [Kwoniella shandongensis]|uniref:Uncharacterized protein n=1 Tax=Kwoniella shandongensis TaxID=1734106 RepID=A0A5M6BS61_9TREE|nr:uncharacterized protein CI109_006012 [Kwoniella shandongensis]KAA5525704.1 hypothetical protein CI109_006012 [Kwoniella shandongensis]